MSEHLKLGEIITRSHQRDAIHIAVLPMEAGQEMAPGAHVHLKDGKGYSGPVGRQMGVVDPFLRRPVKEGEHFWLFMYPGSITALRHEWDHPLAPSTHVSESERWLRELCEEVSFPYERLIEGVDKFDNSTGDDEDASYQLNGIVNGPRG